MRTKFNTQLLILSTTLVTLPFFYSTATFSSSETICTPSSLDVLSVLDEILIDAEKIPELPWSEKAALWRKRHQQLVQTNEYTGETAARELIELFGFDPRLESLLLAIDKKTKSIEERLSFYQKFPEQFKNFAPSSTTNAQRKQIYDQVFEDLLVQFNVKKTKSASSKTKGEREELISKAHLAAEKFSGYQPPAAPQKNTLSSSESILKALNSLKNTSLNRWGSDQFQVNQFIFSRHVVKNRDIESAVKLAFGSLNPKDWPKNFGLQNNGFQPGKTTHISNIIDDQTHKKIKVSTRDLLDGESKKPARQIELSVSADLKRQPPLPNEPLHRAIHLRAQEMMIDAKLTLTGHFLRRMQERQFTLAEVFNIIENPSQMIIEQGNRFKFLSRDGKEVVLQISGPFENEISFITVISK